jgi:hypothetical protein
MWHNLLRELRGTTPVHELAAAIGISTKAYRDLAQGIYPSRRKRWRPAVLKIAAYYHTSPATIFYEESQKEYVPYEVAAPLQVLYDLPAPETFVMKRDERMTVDRALKACDPTTKDMLILRYAWGYRLKDFNGMRGNAQLLLKQGERRVKAFVKAERHEEICREILSFTTELFLEPPRDVNAILHIGLHLPPALGTVRDILRVKKICNYEIWLYSQYVPQYLRHHKRLR